LGGKALFIVHDLYQDDIHFPLGAGYLASALDQMGAKVDIFDQAAHHQPNYVLAKYLDTTEWDIIGVSFLAARYIETVKPLLDVISKHKKGALLVVGGHGPSPIPEYILNTTGVDIVAIGEAEETIVELLDAKVNNKPLSTVNGIAYKEDGKVITNERRPPIKNLDTIPFPAWHLFDMEKYTTAVRLFNQKANEKSLQILTGRGCTGHCAFCYRLEKGVRLRSIPKVIEEIKLLKDQYGVAYFLFADELFLITKKRFYEFRDALEENDLKIKFVCDARVELLDEEFCKDLKAAGCAFCNVGFESMSQPVLEAMGKRVTVEDNIRAAESLKKANLSTGLNIIWGNPYDTAESLREGVDFIIKYTDYSQLRTIRPVTPYPGSPLYDLAIEKGLLSGPGDFFEKFKNSDLITVNFTDIQTREMYDLLFRANHDLIKDYYYQLPDKLTKEEADKLISDFADLYYRGQTDFRGARHYAKKEGEGGE